MDDTPYYCTAEALADLKDLLAELRGPARDELRARFAESQGEETELEENTAYQLALTELAALDQRIGSLSDLVARAVVQSPDGRVVTAGSLVTVVVREPGRPRGRSARFLVDSGLRHDADDVTVVSPTSPMGRALLGSAAGDRLEWTAPVGTFTGKVTSVEVPPT